MGQPKTSEIEAQLGEWEFLKELPAGNRWL